MINSYSRTYVFKYSLFLNNLYVSSRIGPGWGRKVRNINTNQFSPGEIELPNQHYDAGVKSSDNLALD